jgi:prephenate dehydratase
MSEPRRIAFLGPAGTFSEEAALRYCASAELLPRPSFPAAVQAVETGEADETVIPIENSLEGSVSITLDLLIHDTALVISGELVLPVRHFLIAKPATSLDAISLLVSHPQPLGQCRRFLARQLPNVAVVASLSTASAVIEALATPGATAAAISTRRAADLYGGVILAEDIQDQDNNVTRFVVLSRDARPPTGHDRTSLCFTLHGARQPGSLYAALACFAELGINLSKLESRPTKEELGVYTFLIDLDGHQRDPVVAEALTRLKRIAKSVKLFGSYPRTEQPRPSTEA